MATKNTKGRYEKKGDFTRKKRMRGVKREKVCWGKGMAFCLVGTLVGDRGQALIVGGLWD